MNSLQRLYDGNAVVYVGYSTYFFRNLAKFGEIEREISSNFRRRK